MVGEAQCQRCRLAETRAQVVVGRGSLQARVMFTGEAPGRMEDRSGLGFQGSAGKKFDQMLEFLGLKRPNIWLNNAVRCRPVIGGKNRPPTMDELTACRVWLEGDLSAVDPQLVVPLGRMAYWSLTGKKDFSLMRGKLVRLPNLPLMYPIFHPAYLIYRRAAVDQMCQDLKGLRSILDEQGISHTAPGTALCGQSL